MHYCLNMCVIAFGKVPAFEKRLTAPCGSQHPPPHRRLQVCVVHWKAATTTHRIVDNGAVRVFTIDSAALGLAELGCGTSFRQKFTLEDAIGSHACLLEALAGV
jgi:hypothetical protein